MQALTTIVITLKMNLQYLFNFKSFVKLIFSTIVSLLNISTSLSLSLSSSSSSTSKRKRIALLTRDQRIVVQILQAIK